MLDFPNNPEFIFTFLIRGVETFILDQSPDGWQKTQIQFATSKTYTAARRSLSDPYIFMGNAAMICRREWYTYGAMANIIMTIKQRQQNLTYKPCYIGKLNFADPSAGDVQNGFMVPSVTADFTLNIDAYDSVNYEIDISDGVNVELPSLVLNETATLIITGPTDGKLHSDYFPPINVINNTQSSVQPSVQSVQYSQLRDPDLTLSPLWFFHSQIACTVYMTGNISFNVTKNSFGSTTLKLQFIDAAGTVFYTFYNDIVNEGANINVNLTLNSSFSVNSDDFLFLYMQQVEAESENTGINIVNTTINLSYQTQSPPTMTKAVSGEQLFSKLLTALNFNYNSGPNLAVPYQSFLLNSGVLKPVYFTCSDSIRSGAGSFFSPDNTIGQGVYKVIQGTVEYNGNNYTAPATFSFDGTLTFSQVGALDAYVQKIQSIFVGNVYNSGDSLEIGGTFLVEAGSNGTGGIIYNGKFIAIGTYFDYILGQDTFTQSDIGGNNFVKQTAEAPRIVTNLADFFQCIKSLMFGDACLGTGVNGVFIETLATAFQAGAPVNADLGIASAAWILPPATDMQYSNFKAGYADQQYTTANGYQEVNSSQEYTTGVMLTTSSAPAGTYPNEANFVNPYRADPLGYEEMRISQNDTAASRSNNEVCMLWLNLTPIVRAGYTFYRPLGKSDVDTLYGVVDGYYNFPLSGKSCLYRGINYLASIFYNLTQYPIILASALKNSAMVYIIDGVRVGEDDTVLIPATATPYFIPYYLTDTVGISTAMLSKVDINQYAPIKINVNNIDCYGFAIDFKVNAARGDNEALKLLLAPRNKLVDFVR